MKRKENFTLREIAGNFIIVPFGDEALDFNGLITLNDSARFLWEKSEGEFTVDGLKTALIEEYGIDDSTASEAVEVFLSQMKEVGCLE